MIFDLDSQLHWLEYFRTEKHLPGTLPLLDETCQTFILCGFCYLKFKKSAYLPSLTTFVFSNYTIFCCSERYCTGAALANHLRKKCKTINYYKTVFYPTYPGDSIFIESTIKKIQHIKNHYLTNPIEIIPQLT